MASGGRQQVDAQPRRADVVGLLRDQVAALLEARGRSRERERDQQTEQGEDRALGGAEARGERVLVLGVSVPAHAPPDLHG
jgi:hypothetical protein